MIQSHLMRLLKIDEFNLSFSTVSGSFFHENIVSRSSRVHVNPRKQNKVDQFTINFLNNHIETTMIQKYILKFGSSLAALKDPRRHDMIACLGEMTGAQTLKQILELMKEDPEAQQVLVDKPRINTGTICLDALRKLPQNTFGRTYVQFLDDNNVTPDSRQNVKFLDDPYLAYVMTRYRECHDLIHAVLGMPTNMLGEVAVKWVEALNIGLPMCYGGAIFGAIRLRPKQRVLYVSQYLPWAIANGNKIKPLMLIYWEKRWEQDITNLRNELNITTLKILQ